MVKFFNEVDLLEAFNQMEKILNDIDDMKTQIKDLTEESKQKEKAGEKIDDNAYCIMFCHPADAIKFIDDEPDMANIILASPRFKELELKLVDEAAFEKWLKENAEVIQLHKKNDE